MTCRDKIKMHGFHKQSYLTKRTGLITTNGDFSIHRFYVRKVYGLPKTKPFLSGTVNNLPQKGQGLKFFERVSI